MTSRYSPHRSIVTVALFVIAVLALSVAVTARGGGGRGGSSSKGSSSSKPSKSSSSGKKVSAAAAAAAVVAKNVAKKEKSKKKKSKKKKQPTLDIDEEVDETPEESPESGNDKNACFPAHSTAILANGTIVPMEQLSIGDVVYVGQQKTSQVFAFTHRDFNTRSSFVRAKTASGNILLATSGHFLYVDNEPRPLGKVSVGDRLLLASGEEDFVTSITFETHRGLFNPQTLHGDIVVNNIVATTYTTAVEPSIAHAVLAPFRAAYQLFGFSLSITG